MEISSTNWVSCCPAKIPLEMGSIVDTLLATTLSVTRVPVPAKPGRSITLRTGRCKTNYQQKNPERIKTLIVPISQQQQGGPRTRKNPKKGKWNEGIEGETVVIYNERREVMPLWSLPGRRNSAIMARREGHVHFTARDLLFKQHNQKMFLQCKTVLPTLRVGNSFVPLFYPPLKQQTTLAQPDFPFLSYFSFSICHRGLFTPPTLSLQEEAPKLAFLIFTWL